MASSPKSDSDPVQQPSDQKAVTTLATEMAYVSRALRGLPARPVRYEDGWDLYRKMGSPKFVCAPMVDQSELPFRMLTRNHGTTLCYTPMLHAVMFSTKKNEVYRRENFTTAPEDRPLIVQFCANKPEPLLASALIVQSQCDAVDINLGCPQGIAKKGHYGSFLLDHPEEILPMVRTLHQELDVPVTCKIRMLPSVEDTLKLCHALQEAGCAILTVHGRTRDCKKQFTGPNNFDIIKRIKQELSIPVFANGGIETFDDVKKCLDYTGADAVMSSEALLDNPALFSGQKWDVDPLGLADEYLQLAAKYPGASPAHIRAHLFKLLYPRLTVHTDLRDKLAHSFDFADVVAGLRKAEAELGGPDAAAKVYSQHPRWYLRHLAFKPQVNQPKKKKGEKVEAKEDGKSSLDDNLDGICFDDLCVGGGVSEESKQQVAKQ